MESHEAIVDKVDVEEALRRTLAQPDLHGRNGEAVFDMKPMHVKQFIRSIPATVFRPSCSPCPTSFGSTVLC